jgi:hypothetical protein
LALIFTLLRRKKVKLLKNSNKDMRRRFFVRYVSAGVAGLAIVLAQLGVSIPAAAKDKITLEVLDPRGNLVSTELTGLSNPRVKDLDGQRIALLSEKPDSVLFFNSMEKLLKKAYPTATILRFQSPANPMMPDNTLEVTEACDVWLEGVKTSTSSGIDHDIIMEKLGKPGVTFSVESLVPQRLDLAMINGMPTIRIISLPTMAYFKAKASQEKMDIVAAEAFDDTIRALTEPLTKAEKYPDPFHYDYSPKKFTGSSYAEANEKFQEYCSEHFMGDGFPVVPPTREAVKVMLTGTSLSPEKEIGIMYPRRGIATVEKIAINAVMAGAKPEYLPVIITMVECITDERFNQYHIVTGPMPVFWISGPIVEEIGLNNGIGYLSPGYRANSTIARALAMCSINIGWRLMNIYAMPGGPGTPAAYTNYLIPENQKKNPWESYAIENGYKPEESIVSANETLWVSNGPGETLDFQSFEESMDMMADLVAPSGRLPGLGFTPEGIRHEIVLHPTMAKKIADAGFTRQSFVQWLYDKTAIVWDKMSKEEKERFKRDVAEGKHPGIRLEDCKSGLALEPFTDPKHVAVLVSGDAAGQTLVFATLWGSTARKKGEGESIPFITKVIRGATLTRSGR